jgi:hypothetical protein
VVVVVVAAVVYGVIKAEGGKLNTHPSSLSLKHTHTHTIFYPIRPLLA